MHKAVPVMGQGRILFMDDEMAIRELATEMLTRLGYRITTSADDVGLQGCMGRICGADPKLAALQYFDKADSHPQVQPIRQIVVIGIAVDIVKALPYSHHVAAL